MDTALVTLTVVYLLVGIAVYAFSDTTAVAGRLESLLIFVPFGVVQRYLFLFVVGLWPVWLVAYPFARGPGRD